MTQDEYISWVGELAEQGRITSVQAEDAVEQRIIFDAQRPMIEDKYSGFAVGVVNGDLIVEGSVDSLLDWASARFPDRMVYFEPIGYRAF
ncbi:hypothetical protein ACODT4_20720 [Streptomyces sp. 2.9]|uniref:hypothetical protein n=1 Tax=Streptomyces tritrimontium TaxID=3406573 RepID=UPI003BB7724C